MSKLSDRLKELRTSAGLSQKELAKALNNQVSASSIGYWEQEKRIPNIDAMLIIADYFDVSLDYLVGRED